MARVGCHGRGRGKRGVPQDDIGYVKSYRLLEAELWGLKMQILEGFKQGNDMV
jgi:hypothetical protein